MHMKKERKEHMVLGAQPSVLKQAIDMLLLIQGLLHQLTAIFTHNLPFSDAQTHIGHLADKYIHGQVRLVPLIS